MKKVYSATPPKKLKILRVISAAFLLLAAFVIYSLATTSLSKQYERARQSCSTELWLVERDAVFYDTRRIRQPYPTDAKNLAGEEVVDFSCSQSEAESKREAAKSTGVIGYFLALSIFIWGPAIPIVIIWWLIEESRYWRFKKTN